jgi:hypothetical protein
MSSDLLARLTTAGLGRVASDIAHLSMPSIRMDCRPANDRQLQARWRAGSGTRPELADVVGSPMAFIAQVKLSRRERNAYIDLLLHTADVDFRSMARTSSCP